MSESALDALYAAHSHPIEATEKSELRAHGKFVSAYVTRYCKYHVHKAFLAIEDGDEESADGLLRQYLRENWNISPWTKYLLRRYIGQV